MHTAFELGETTLEVVTKDVKNVQLSVYPPTGNVKIVAPLRMKLDTIRLFAIAKLRWIREQQRQLREQAREGPREYVDRESHYVWGRRCLLTVVEEEAAPGVNLRQARLSLRVRPGADGSKREDVMASWYRQLLRDAAQPLIAAWEKRLQVTVTGFYVRHMKTKWGSCNPSARTIRLNTELAKKPRECLDYVVLHEMAHLLEPKHGPRFLALLDSLMPTWRDTRDLLNRLPARHERWSVSALSAP
jgi:predicted metal-dependent hydrolase